MAYEGSESSRENSGKFIYQFQPKTKTLVKKLERILITLYEQDVSFLLLYRVKEKIHSEIELIIYQLKWYSPTNIISLALLVLGQKLVLLRPFRAISLLLFLLLLLRA